MLRRFFLSRLAAAPMVGIAQQAAAPPPSKSSFEPARHPQDEWFDQLPGRHRVVFDTFMAERFPEAVMFAGNYVRANRDSYELTEKDLAIVIIVRHQTAPFAFNDAMWAKYGKHFAARMLWVDPRTKEVPSANVHKTALTNLIGQGLHMGVCNLTTRAYTRIIADATNQKADDVYKELTANTLGNSHFVPAGIVAVTRAQEHGYSLVSVA